MTQWLHYVARRRTARQAELGSEPTLREHDVTLLVAKLDTYEGKPPSKDIFKELDKHVREGEEVVPLEESHD